MSKSPSKTLIGAFTVGAAALLLLAIGVFGSGTLFKETARFVLFFDKSITGLSVGSPVVFQGVPVGRVVAIRLNGDLENKAFSVPVYIELDLNDDTQIGDSDELDEEEYLDELIRHGLRASLATQSLLTGQLMVELNFVADGTQGLTKAQTRTYRGIPQIPTVPSKLDSIWHKLTTLPIEEISANILSLSEGLNKAVNNNHFKEMLTGMDELLAQLRSLAANVDVTLDSVRHLADEYAGLARSMDPKLSRTLGEASSALAAVSAAASKAEKTMTVAGGVVDRNSRTMIELDKALREISEAARAVRVLAGMLERHPEALLRGKGARQ